MMGYRYLIFDVDGTLLNFGHAYCRAQKAVAEKLGVSYTPEYVALDEKLSWKGWRESGLEDTGSAYIQAHYHSVYYDYLRRHFTYLLEALGMSRDVEELVACYLESVAESREWMEPDTLEVFRQLAGAHKLVLATNGISQVQRPRVRELLPYTEAVFISEEMGCIKPGEAFFQKMLADLGCGPKDCLMVGDSLSNDIKGAKSVGMPTCWYNPKGKEAGEGDRVDFVIKSIKDLEAVCG
ncbi:HAD family hydrolase [bacterium D16-76]|nr:HAD family hydrolase [bacterium D16-76]